MPGPRWEVVVAVALPLGFLFLAGLPPAPSDLGLVRAHLAVLLRQGLQGSGCGRLSNRIGKPSVDWVESL